MKIRNALVTLFLVAGFFLVSFLISDPAMAQTVSVPQIELQGLDAYRGRNVTVIYGLGNRAAIATADDQLTLREVKLKRTLRIEDGSVLIPRADLSRSGIFLPYNLVVFVIHDGPEFSWRNLNGSYPDGETHGPSLQAVAVGSLIKTEIDALIQKNGGADTLRVTFGAKL